MSVCLQAPEVFGGYCPGGYCPGDWCGGTNGQGWVSACPHLYISFCADALEQPARKRRSLKGDCAPDLVSLQAATLLASLLG